MRRTKRPMTSCLRLSRLRAAELLATISRTEFKNTYRALFGFIFKTNALKTGIFDAVESEHPYVLRILFRSVELFEARNYAKSLHLSESLIGNNFALDLDRLVARYYPKAALLTARLVSLRIMYIMLNYSRTRSAPHKGPTSLGLPWP